ncbi:Mitochondrial adenine nucleotide transporter ADNT1 [Linum grandiflorum]
MASEDVKTSGEAAVSTIVNLAEEAKLAREGVKTQGPAFLSICKSLVAGGVAGGVSRTAVAPLERLKILLQEKVLNASFHIILLKHFICFCSLVINRGILWFYRRQTGKDDAQLTPVLRLGAGACAGIIAMSATYPMDMVRGRLTVQTDQSPRQYRGIAHALRTVLKEEGARALYKGWLPSVIGVVPYVGLNFAVYESLKDWLLKSNTFNLVENNELSVTTRLACGAAAGTVGQTVAYPLDVIRRRMQMVGWKDAASVVTGDGRGKAPLEYTGMVDAFRKTVRYEGFGALYKGLVPNSVKVVPSIAIAFVSYEMVKDVLGVEMRISD